MLGKIWKTVVAALAVLASADAHGFMKQPMSRNYLAHLAGQEYDHMSLNGGGPWSVWPSGAWAFGGGGDHAACGRAQYDAPGPTQAVWAAGQTVDLVVEVTAAHKGHMYFGLCPSSQPPTPACFAQHWLVAENGLPYWDLGDKGTGTYPMRFKLPPGFSCEKCTLWWWYLTGNSCVPPGSSGNMQPCGAPGAIPEEFFNCADIRILSQPVNSPSPPPPKKLLLPPPPKQKRPAPPKKKSPPPPSKRCTCPCPK